MITRRSIALAALVACAAAFAGCMTTTKTILEQKEITVQLISKRGDNVVLNHPTIISPVRLSHILARIDIRLSIKEGQQRVPAFHIESLDSISEGLAKGLREAGPNQRVIVYSIRREKRFGIFDTNYLTSFIAFPGRIRNLLGNLPIFGSGRRSFFRGGISQSERERCKNRFFPWM